MSISDAEYTAWLNDDTAIPCVLVEVNIVSGGTPVTLFLSSQNYRDPDTGRQYQAIVESGLATTEALTVDAGGMSWGDTQYNNPSGEYDYVTAGTLVWANRPFRSWLGDVRWAKGDFRPELIGIVDDIGSSAQDKLNLKTRDILKRLDYPASETVLGGTGQDKDTLIPLTFGWPINITPLFVGTLDIPISQTYQVHTGAIGMVKEVRDNAMPIPTTDSLSTGKFALVNAKAIGAVTCDIKGGYVGTFSAKVADVVKDLVKNYGSPYYRLTDADLDLASFSAFNTAYPYEVGYYYTSKTNVGQICAELLASIGAFMLPTRAGKLALYRFELPNGAPVMTITAAHMASNFSLRIVNRVKPIAGVAVNYCKNWTVQADIKTNIPEECKKLLAQEWRVVRASNSTVADLYQDHATPIPRDTYLIDEAQAQLVADYHLSIESRLRTTYEFDGLAPCLELNKGDEIFVVHHRFNMQSGVSAIVTELQRNPFDRTVKVQFTVFEEVVSGITAGGTVPAGTNKINDIFDATSPRILGNPTGTFTAGALTVVPNGSLWDITVNLDYEQGDVKATELMFIAKGDYGSIPAAPDLTTTDVIRQSVPSDTKSHTFAPAHPSIYWRVSIVARQQINGVWYNSAVTSPAGWTVTGTTAIVSGTFKRDILITLVFDTITAGKVFTLPPWPFAIKFFAGLPDSNFKAGVAATATTVITIKNNSTSIGTLTFAAAGTVPTVAFAADYESAVDDELSFHFPATADATLDNFRVNMVAWR